MLSSIILSHYKWKNLKVIVSVLAMMVSQAITFAQDKIFKTDNTVIEATVLKISDSQVDYKKYSNQNGPVYSLFKKDISMIIYKNGEKDIFNAPEAKTSSGKPSASAAPIKFGTLSIDNARAQLLTGNINNAIGVYALIFSKDSTNRSLISEYAYALALGGMYDASLARLDLIWESRGINREADFYASQVYELMGYKDLADEFRKEPGKGTPPSWISSKAPDLLERYKRTSLPPVSDNRERLVNEFKRANRLTARNYYLQSLSLFEEITRQHPQEYLPYIGYSISLEKAGFFDRSAQMIENAIRIIEVNAEEKETVQILEKRLSAVKDEAAGKNSSSKPGVSSSGSVVMKPQMLLYAGGQLSSSYSSMNAKLGLFLSKTSYTSVDFGYTGVSGSSSANLGLSIYDRSKLFVLGFGFSANFSSNATVLYSKISVGPSFMNKNHTASWDIFLDGRTALSKGYSTSMGISIGRSIYFGKRK